MKKIAEVIEASTADFTAECYELYQPPSFGSLVKTVDSTVELYGIVYQATTASIEPGRRPLARGRDEATEEDVYRSSPQLTRLLRSEFSVLVAGYRQDDKLCHYLPPRPARIHGFVYPCSPEEVRAFSQSLDFLSILINSRPPASVEELVAAALRHMSEVYEDGHAFMVAAGKELAVLLSGDFIRLKTILGRIR